MQAERVNRGEAAPHLADVATSAADTSPDVGPVSGSVSIKPTGINLPATTVPWERSMGVDVHLGSSNTAEGTFISITNMAAYSSCSFEELRVGDWLQDRVKLLGWDGTVAAYGNAMVHGNGSTVICPATCVSVRANRGLS